MWISVNKIDKKDTRVVDEVKNKGIIFSPLKEATAPMNGFLFA